MTAATSSARAPGSSAPATLDDLWEEVIGQPELVDALRAAAESPVHAYLLVGPEGSGRRAAAAAFAAELLVRSAAETAGGSLEAIQLGNGHCRSIEAKPNGAPAREHGRERAAGADPVDGRLQADVIHQVLWYGCSLGPGAGPLHAVLDAINRRQNTCRPSRRP